ncbi:MAG: hypothetical protein A2139_05365 [Desulfobacca sp. RBG_16_60_12]|nr:MAG: hypothetical protein A2139_05365 [Desulfobacca sp. RBG_16_60_12]
MTDAGQWDYYLTAASFLILGIYHLHWLYLIYRKPMATAVGITNHLRGHWVESIMEERRDILAVQTLRNWTMAASFLASTGILICLGLLSVAASPEKMAEITPSLNAVVQEHRVLWLFKLMVLIVDFFFIFFSFCLSIRYLNHVNFMINVPFNLAHKITPEYITGILNRGMMHYTMGMRGYYFSVLLFLWLFGPIWMLIGTVVMTIVLYHLDRQA